VEKDGASVLYGPNSMGGAINLISAKPTHRLELNGGAGWLTGGYESNVNAGARLNKFYFQANASQYKRDYYNMSKDFVPTKTEDGDRRDNSYNNDWKYGFKIGFQPNSKSEYAIGYTNQQGSKGTPVYTGTDTLNPLYKSPRYWQWPKWNKQSIYFISNTALSSKSNLSTRVFYDQFINVLKSFDNATYTTQTKPYAFTSYYNDYSIGASAVYTHRIAASNNLNAAVHFKQDVHRENNEGEPVRKMSDNTYSIGVTDKQTFNSYWSAEAGVSFNERESLTAQNYNSTTKAVTNFPSNDNSAVNVQGKLTYDVTSNRSFALSGSRMTRFATMKDRYSYRMGTAVPNPDLHAEHAFNTSLQYEDNSLKNVSIHAAVFYSRLNDVIQTVSNAYHDTTTNKWLAQSQNTGRAEFYGTELAVKYNFLQHFSSGLNYNFIKRKNLDKPSVRFTDVPEN
jgi:iron complex outermembrane receptor protein